MWIYDKIIEVRISHLSDSLTCCNIEKHGSTVFLCNVFVKLQPEMELNLNELELVGLGVDKQEQEGTHLILPYRRGLMVST